MLTQIAVLVPVARIDEARLESQTYHRLRGEDLPLESFLVDEVRDANGELTHYACERLLRPDEADHVMQYYHDQFSENHTPAQVLTRESLDDALARIGGVCQKHEQRKADRLAAQQRYGRELIALRRKASRVREVKEISGG